MEYKCLNCGLDPVKVPYYMDATRCPKCGRRIDDEYVNIVKEKRPDYSIPNFKTTMKG